MTSGCKDMVSMLDLNLAADILGDRWSLLVIRNLMFATVFLYGTVGVGRKHCDKLVGKPLATSVLHGVAVVGRQQSDKRKRLYLLTSKGIELAPVLIEMLVWTAKHTPEARNDHRRSIRTRFLGNARKHWVESQRRVMQTLTSDDR